MKTWKRIGAVLFAIMVAASAQAHADSAAEMLEKGIYNEDTVGNLDEAIKIYRKVVELGEQAEAVAAKAQFRLAQCLLKKGQRSEATAAFKKIVTDFPNQKDWVTKAKQHLPNALRFQDAPWKNGECLTLEMRLSGGHPIGVVGAYVESAKVDGKDVWKMYVRRFVAGGQNEGTSQVVVDQATNRPLSTSFQHLVLGSAEATWSDSAIDRWTLISPEHSRYGHWRE